MNPKRDEERKAVLDLVQEVEDLLKLRQTTDEKRTAFEKAGKKSEAEELGRKIEDINTRALPALEKKIRDTANAMRDRKLRDRLEKLRKRISAQAPLIRTRRVNISREHETELALRHHGAKTTPQRIKATGEIEQLARDKQGRAQRFTQGRSRRRIRR